MPQVWSTIVNTKSLAETEALAAQLARLMRAPATILLQGGIGAGKSAFARAFIRAAGLDEIDIPSPTFTLVQTYDTGLGPIWHSDLYRLTSVDEVEELGLFDAFEEAICLIEWPEKLEADAPKDALLLSFSPGKTDDGRMIEISGLGNRWSSLAKALA